MPNDIALGSGLSGFAQGFASSFLTEKEHKAKLELEEKKNMREMLVKHVLDPNNPIDLSTNADPAMKKSVSEAFGHAAPLFEKLSARNSEFVYQKRQDALRAQAQPLATGEERKVKTAYGEETLKGPPQPKPGKSIEDIKAETTAREQAKEPFAARKQKRAAAEREKAAIRAEKRQYRDEVRKTAIKLSSDPKTRTWGETLHNWLRGTDPSQRLNTALAGIPTEALPATLQAKQAEGQQQPAAAPAAPAASPTGQPAGLDLGDGWSVRPK